MDQSFNRGTLARSLVAKDFYLDQSLGDDIYRQTIISKALDKAENSDSFSPRLDVDLQGKKPIYSVNSLEDKLILRKCTQNIKHAAGIFLKPRNQIIKEIKTYLKEGSSYRIYRLDISSFFESCAVDDIIQRLQTYNISTQTYNLVNSFLSYFKANYFYSLGIPRGVEISPILSELCLQNFDERVSAQSEVFYFSRFVDDIFIITSGNENKKQFMKLLRQLLPKELHFNHNKMQIQDIPKRSSGTQPSPNPIISQIDYLGYKLSIVDNDLSTYSNPKHFKKVIFRNIQVDLTDNKTKTIFEKILKSFYSFSKDRNFSLLHDRILFLATNRDLVNKQSKRKVPTGIYYNYSEVTTPSNAIGKIDRLLKTMIINPSGRLGNLLDGKLTKEQKNKLLKISFTRGHIKKTFKRFSPNQLRIIARIW